MVMITIQGAPTPVRLLCIFNLQFLLCALAIVGMLNAAKHAAPVAVVFRYLRRFIKAPSP